jgi:hypothetical protein
MWGADCPDTVAVRSGGLAVTLSADGDTVQLAGGRMLRLKILPDENYSINEYDSDGKVSDAHRYADGNLDNGGAQRPDGFDGGAVKIEVGQDSWAWWQPCKDAVYPTPEDFEKDKRRVSNLCQYGFVGVRLEVCEGEDAYHRPIVRQEASVWGEEWDCMENSYGQEIIGDLAAELGVEIPAVEVSNLQGAGGGKRSRRPARKAMTGRAL